MNSSLPANSLNMRASANIISLIKSFIFELSIDTLPDACISLSPSEPTPFQTPVYLTDGFSLSPGYSIVSKSCPGPTSAAGAHLRIRERSSREWKGGAGFSALCALHFALSELRTNIEGGNDAKAAVESFTHLYTLAVAITRSSRWHTAEELARLCASAQISAVLAVLSFEEVADPNPNSWKWIVYNSGQVNGKRPVIALVRRGANDHYTFFTRNKTNPEDGTSIDVAADIPIEEIHLKTEHTSNTSLAIPSAIDLLNKLQEFVPELKILNQQAVQFLSTPFRLIHTGGIVYLSRALSASRQALATVPPELIDSCLQTLAVQVCELEEGVPVNWHENVDANYRVAGALLVLALRNYAASSPPSSSKAPLNCFQFSPSDAHPLRRFAELALLALGLCKAELHLLQANAESLIVERQQAILMGVRALWMQLSDFYARAFLAKLVSHSTSALTIWTTDRKILQIVLELKINLENIFRTLKHSNWTNIKLNTPALGINKNKLQGIFVICIDQLANLDRLFKRAPPSSVFAQPSSTSQQPFSDATTTGRLGKQSTAMSTRPDAGWVTALLLLSGPDPNRSLVTSIRWAEMFCSRRGLRSPSESVRATIVHLAVSTVLTHALQVDAHANLSHTCCVPLIPSSENQNTKQLTAKIKRIKTTSMISSRKDGQKLELKVFRAKETHVRFEDLANIDIRAFASPKKQPSRLTFELRHLLRRGEPNSSETTPFRRLAPLPQSQKSPIIALLPPMRNDVSHPRPEWREVRLADSKHSYLGQSRASTRSTPYKSMSSLVPTSNQEEPAAQRRARVRRAYSMLNLRRALSTASSGSSFASAPASTGYTPGWRPARDENSIHIDDGPLLILLKQAYPFVTRSTCSAPAALSSIIRKNRKHYASLYAARSSAQSKIARRTSIKRESWQTKFEQRIPKRIQIKVDHGLQLPEIPAARHLMVAKERPNAQLYVTH